MDSAAAARTGQQPAGHGAAAPRLAVVLGGPGGSPRAFRVEAPDRVLRMWDLLNIAGEELHQVTLPPGAVARLRRQLDAVTAELQRSVSPALAGELRRLIGQGRGGGPSTLAGLRIDYAGVLGWTGGLVVAMLSQLEAVPAGPAGRPGRGARPDRSRPRDDLRSARDGRPPSGPGSLAWTSGRLLPQAAGPAPRAREAQGAPAIGSQQWDAPRSTGPLSRPGRDTIAW